MADHDFSVASERGDLPPADASLVLIRVAIEAYLATVSRRQAKAFFRVAAEILADEESVALLFPIRPSSEQGEVNRARRQAVAIFRQWAPVFAARMPPR